MIKYFNQYKGLSKEIYVIFFAKMVNSMGNFVIPFLTFFLERKLNLPEDQAGEILLWVTFMYVPGSIIGGKLTDVFGRRKIIFIFQGLSAIIFFICGFLRVSMLIPKLLIISRLFISISSPAYAAMIIDLTKPNNRKVSMSLLYLGGNIGFAVGPLIAGFLFENYIKWVFIGDALTSFVSIALIFLVVKETKPTEKDVKEIESSDRVFEKSDKGSALGAFLRRPTLVLFCVFGTLLSFIYIQHSFTIPLQLSELFNEKSSSVYGYIMSINGIVVIFSTPFLIYITRKLRSIQCVVIAGIFYSIGFGMLYFADSMWIFLVSVIIWTLGEVLESTQMGVYIANHSPITHRGRFNSIFEIVRGIGYAIGPQIIGNYLARENSIQSVWSICFVIGLIATIMLYILNLYEIKKIKKEDLREI